MAELTGAQVRHLRSLAHHLEPVVQVGKLGVTDTLIHAVNEVLEAHELIKLKFVDKKEEKESILAEITARTNSQQVSLLGHVAILYRWQPNEEKRRIELPRG